MRTDPTGPIAILSALPDELNHLVVDRLAGDLERPEQISLATEIAWRGTLGGHDVVVALSGMGKVAAALVATSLIEMTRPRALVFSGVAGGLDPALDVGDVVIAERVVQHDTGVLTDAGLQHYQPSHLPFINPTDDFGSACDPALVALAVEAAGALQLDALPTEAGGRGHPPQITTGVVATGDVFVNGNATRRRLFEELGAHVVEMEGGAVAQVADALGVPHLIVRAVADKADDDGDFDFHQFTAHVALNSARIVEHVAAALRLDSDNSGD
ncbi:MAG: 5'-methylthioadenosine/adenosylhomocysteine nucleosidase [Actinomycetota bacterium]